jgi:recombination associated protein RdgC
MFKNAVLLRAVGPLNLGALISGAQAREFASCGPTQPKSAGFVPPRSKGQAMVESIGKQWIIAIRTQTKSVPASEVKKRLEAALDLAEKEIGRRPKGKAVREMKEQIIHELLPQAFPKDSQVNIWIDPSDGLVVVGTQSWSRAGDLTLLLADTLPGVQFSAIQTASMVEGCMGSWLLAKEAPPGFSLDRECELKQPDGEKAVVRYSRHTLDIDEVGEHIKQGKSPTRVAMTRGGRVSFVLANDRSLRKINILDSAVEAAAGNEAADAFDADFAIATGELRPLIDDLIAALDGEVEPRKAAAE